MTPWAKFALKSGISPKVQSIPPVCANAHEVIRKAIIVYGNPPHIASSMGE